MASKVLLIKEPLQALDECKNASCYQDVKIEKDLTVDEIFEQMRMCLDYVNATGPLYDDLLSAVEYVHEQSSVTIDDLITRLESDDNEKVRNLLHKIISIQHELEDNHRATVKKSDENYANVAKELAME